MFRLTWLVGILFIAGSFSVCLAVAPGHLEWVAGVPDENRDAYFLVSPIDLDVSKPYIFISDQAQSRIFRLDLDGRFQKVIGGRGQGPGEFSMQGAIAADSKFIAVEDQGNRRVQLLTHDGQFVSMYRQAMLWHSGVFLNGMLLVNPAFPPERRAVPVDSHLLLFDLEGHMRGKTGGFFPVSLRGDRFDMANRLVVKRFEGGVVAAQYFGNIVRVYRENLRMTGEFVLNHPGGDTVMGYVFDVCEGRIYVAALPSKNTGRILVYTYSMSGKFLGELELRCSGKKIIPKDLAVIRRGDRLWFYFLVIEPETELLIARL